MKLYGFYRVSKTQPAPIVPIFKDSNGALHIQKIGIDNKIASFLPICPERERVIINENEISEQRNISDYALFSIEYKNKSIRISDGENIHSLIDYLDRKKYFVDSPFTLLEYAILSGSEPLIYRAIEECKHALETIDRKLFKKWLDGADFDQKYKKIYNEDDYDTEEIHLSFSATYKSLKNLTEFSRNYLREYRNITFSRAIHEIATGGMTFLSRRKVDEFMEIFLKSAEKKASIEVDRIVRMGILSTDSRGNVKIDHHTYNIFLNVVEDNFFASTYINDDLDIHQRAALHCFFFENRSRFIVFLLYMYYFTKFPDFHSFISSREFL